MVKVLGVRVKVIGKSVAKQPRLIVANHISWLDYFVISANDSAYFVIKGEIEDIPFFGFFAKINFITTPRTRRAAQADSNKLTNYLVKGYDVGIFPESTTTSGNLIPFHSAMFAAAAEAYKILKSDVLVQPISLIYTKYNGLPMNTKLLSDFSWCSGRSLLSKVLELVFAIGITEVYVVYHDAIVFNGSINRKEAAIAAENIIRLTLSNYKKYGQVSLI